MRLKEIVVAVGDYLINPSGHKGHTLRADKDITLTLVPEAMAVRVDLANGVAAGTYFVPLPRILRFHALDVQPVKKAANQ